MDEEFERGVKTLSRALAVLAVRNGFLEDLHAGKVLISEVGDFSDVTVVTPGGEIRWEELSRLNNDEMKKLMKQVVDRLYTILLPVLRGDESEELERLIRLGDRYAANWDDAALDEALCEMMRGDE